MGSVTMENVVLASKLGAAVLSFIGQVAPIVAELWASVH